MPLTNDEYCQLEKLLFSTAKGENLTVVQEVQTEEYTDSVGHKHHAQRVKKGGANIGLAMNLLDQRIGGPQDFC